MAQIKKIQENGKTIYPVTITNAIKDPNTGKTLPEMLGDGVQSDGIYPQMAVGKYIAKDAEVLDSSIGVGSINLSGGITSSPTIHHLRVDISEYYGQRLTVRTTNTSQYDSLWALWVDDYDPAKANWKDFVGKGPICSEMQTMTIDLSEYTEKIPKVLYVSIGTEGNTASVSADLVTESIAAALEVINEIPRLILPKVIDCPVGYPCRIYHRSFIDCNNVDNYQVEVLSNIGKSYPKYFIFTPESVGGPYSINVNIRNSSGHILTSGSTLIKPYSVPSNNPTKNILMLGASLVENGTIGAELKRRLTETSGNGTPDSPKGIGLTNISFVGRKKASYSDVMQEATGGWSWREYTTTGPAAYRFQVSGIRSLNMGDIYTGGNATFTIQEINVVNGSGNIRCTFTGTPSLPTSGTLTRTSGSGDNNITYSSATSENFNPFWNPDTNSLDFKQYANLYCNGLIDVIVAVCGTNDLFTTRSINEIVDEIRTFVRAYHADFPNGKVVLASLPIPSPIGGMGANYNATTNNYRNIARRMFDFADAINAILQEEEFTSYIVGSAVMQNFDSEHLYPFAMSPVNNRMPNVTEEIGTNGVHPTIAGYKTIADTIYPSILSIL